MRVQFWIQQQQYKKFLSSCSAVIQNVGAGTKMATERACLDILSDSLGQVPVDTGTLASTAYYKVTRRGDVKGYRYQGIVGYAGMKGGGAYDVGTSDRINPKTGKAASRYAAVVHEDLGMPHPRGGKAKFLEDPVRAYGAGNFKRVAEQYWRWALMSHSIEKRVGGRSYFSTVSAPTAQQKVNYKGSGDIWATKATHYRISFDKGASNRGNYYNRGD